MLGHNAANCSRNWTCNVHGYGQKHNKWLHPNQPRQTSAVTTAQHTSSDSRQTQQTSEPPTVTCGFAGVGNGKVCLPIVPVVVQGKAGSISSVTYALLDRGANTSLVSEELVQKLRIKGTPSKLDLDTVGSHQEGIQTQSVDLEIDSLYNSTTYQINSVRTLTKVNIGLSCLATPQEISQWSHLKDIPIPEINSRDVHLIIGQDAPRLLQADECRVGGDDEPYATRTVLGWAINGPINHRRSRNMAKAFFLNADGDLRMQMEKFWKLDDPEQTNALSINDQKVVNRWEESVCKEGQHYSLDIPFKEGTVELQNNANLATRRLGLLERRLAKNKDLQEMYVEAMRSTIDKGYAEEVPPASLDRNDGKVWYLPHHSVIHPRKPGKIRIVFDCAAKYNGVSLNDVVHSGPDLTNKLIAVLIRFRQGPFAMMADIEGMFNQVHVTPAHRDVLRFLWWKDHNSTKGIVQYRMKSHLFGGVWSPSAASLALKKCASDNAHLYDADTVSTVEQNFYVDDCLKSTDSVKQAVHLAAQLADLLNQGGFHLTKWMSNSPEIMKSIPEEEHAKLAPSLDINHDPAMQRALGLLWDTKLDCLTFSANVEDKPNTKRGMLSTISSIYDPLGLVGPFILRGKALFQTLCRLKLDWDDAIPTEIDDQWGWWLDDLPSLCNLQVPRSLRPVALTGASVTLQLHHFCDASELGYGAVCYLRLVSHDDVNCNIVMSRNRLAPVKPSTIPRLELAAAVVAIQLDQTIRQSFQLPLLDSVFWTDSTIVLHYIKNQKKRFQTFVANRVVQIHNGSNESQWRHVDTSQNPADHVSRGMPANELVNDERWIRGPAFLWKTEEFWPSQPDLGDMPLDAEIKKPIKIYPTLTKEDVTRELPIDKFFLRYSSWHKLKRAVALILRTKGLLQKRSEKSLCSPITPTELRQAEVEFFGYVQCTWLDSQMMINLKKLSPIHMPDGSLHVGGRLANAPVSDAAKHPVILPQHHHITDLIIWDLHEQTGHSGIERVLAEARQSVWIVKGRGAVKRVLRKCLPCKRRKASVSTQLMADLPEDRVTPDEPPFARTGVDYFGPITVKRARSEVKRYGCLFTCLATRAVHLEVAHSLDTDSFINAFHHFTARRGRPNCLRSDNGTNFVGAKHDMQRALEEWNQLKISDNLLQQGTEWIFNPPAASHMGGVWERQIPTVRSILLNLVGQQVLDDEGLAA